MSLVLYADFLLFKKKAKVTLAFLASKSASAIGT